MDLRTLLAAGAILDGIAGGAISFVRQGDRLDERIKAHETRLASLEREGGSTVMADSTRERFTALEARHNDLQRRLERLEERLFGKAAATPLAAK